MKRRTPYIHFYGLRAFWPALSLAQQKANKAVCGARWGRRGDGGWGWMAVTCPWCWERAPREAVVWRVKNLLRGGGPK